MKSAQGYQSPRLRPKVRNETIEKKQSPVAGDVFPQLLTSLSMAKEKYYQPPGVLSPRCKL